MEFGILTIDDFQVKNKTVLCRVDINEPVDQKTGQLKDITRIKACVPTIKELANKGAKVVLLAHQGSDIEYKNYYTTKPHGKVLTELLGRKVEFIDDVCGPAARNRIQALQEGDILLLDNVRFMAEEQTLFELKLKLSHKEQAQTQVVKKLAPLADIYICDAFAAAHRSQPSLCGFEQVLPSAMGRLFEKEYNVISDLMHSPQRPCTFVLGGAKIADAFLMMETVLESGTADTVLAGGLVANILLAAKGLKIGSGSMDFIVKSNYGEYIEKAKVLYEQYSEKIILPKDVAFLQEGVRQEAYADKIPAQATVTDIGSQAALEYSRIILDSKTVFINGPLGIFEVRQSEKGTKRIWEALGQTLAYTVLGGGDSITATKKYGLMNKIDYICTGGGAMIRFLTGEELPVVKALKHATQVFGMGEK
jgi:phosphoglycerate kinase